MIRIVKEEGTKPWRVVVELPTGAVEKSVGFESEERAQEHLDACRKVGYFEEEFTPYRTELRL